MFFTSKEFPSDNIAGKGMESAKIGTVVGITTTTFEFVDVTGLDCVKSYYFSLVVLDNSFRIQEKQSLVHR